MGVAGRRMWPLPSTDHSPDHGEEDQDQDQFREPQRSMCVCVAGRGKGKKCLFWIIRAAQQWRSILGVKGSPLTLGPCKSGWHCDRNTIIKGILVSCKKLL